jgi:hypothetical protein
MTLPANLKGSLILQGCAYVAAVGRHGSQLLYATTQQFGRPAFHEKHAKERMLALIKALV